MIPYFVNALRDNHCCMLFVEFIQVALGHRESLSKSPSEQEWHTIYGMCQQQSVVGLGFSALDRLGQLGQKPPLSILYDWIGIGELIKKQNLDVYKNAVLICELLSHDGYDTCILKGQGNALMYPNSYIRTPGDIDLWVKLSGNGQSKTCNVRRIVGYVKGINPKGNACYHHIDYGLFHGTEVEVHYRPSFMFNPIHNRRLQKWFIAHSEEQFQNEVELPDGVGKVAIPTLAFNIIFQLSHIYNHVLHEGIGLRQFVDYYYLLRSSAKLEMRNEELEMTLKYLGLWKFAGAVMYVMREVFALEEQYMIRPIDEWRGGILFQEILKGGNFGKYDEANIKAASRIKKNIQRINRDIRMMLYFPSECLWEPAFRIYHFFWRMKYN